MDQNRANSQSTILTAIIPYPDPDTQPTPTPDRTHAVFVTIHDVTGKVQSE
jgi:hypothetical protein